MKVTHHLEYIANLLRPVFEKRGVERALIFGSYSRERETRKSDIDLMIIVDTDKRFFDRYDESSPLVPVQEYQGVYRSLNTNYKASLPILWEYHS